MPEPPPPTEPVADAPEELLAARIPNGEFLILSPGNAMLLPTNRRVDRDHTRIYIPRTFLLRCFSPPITSSTQVTAHVVIRTQDVARLPPDADVAQKQSATTGCLHLPMFECNLYNTAGITPCLSSIAQILRSFGSWRLYKLQAVSADCCCHFAYLAVRSLESHSSLLEVRVANHRRAMVGPRLGPPLGCLLFTLFKKLVLQCIARVLCTSQYAKLTDHPRSRLGLWDCSYSMSRQTK